MMPWNDFFAFFVLGLGVGVMLATWAAHHRYKDTWNEGYEKPHIFDCLYPNCDCLVTCQALDKEVTHGASGIPDADWLYGHKKAPVTASQGLRSPASPPREEWR